MSNISFNGLELCYNAFKDKIKNAPDTIVVFVHWYLVKHGFVCICDGKVRVEIVFLL